MSPDEDRSRGPVPLWALLLGIFVAALAVGGIVAAVASSGNGSSNSATGDTTTSSSTVTTILTAPGTGGSGSSSSASTTTSSTKPPAPSSTTPSTVLPPAFFLRPTATIALTPMTANCTEGVQVNVNVTWTTKRATTVHVIGAGLSSNAPSDSQTVNAGNCPPAALSPEFDTYTLTATNSHGTTTRKATLKVQTT